MNQLVLKIKNYFMDQSDIQYIIELISDGIINKDWDVVLEAKETLKEFIDSGNTLDDE